MKTARLILIAALPVAGAPALPGPVADANHPTPARLERRSFRGPAAAGRLRHDFRQPAGRKRLEVEPPVLGDPICQDPCDAASRRPGLAGLAAAHRQRSLPEPAAFTGGNHSYLIKLANDASPVTLTVKGQVVLPNLDWFPHGLNLVGFPVNPANPPTFSDFFKFTTEVNTTLGYANQLFSLDSLGHGLPIVQPNREQIAAGRGLLDSHGKEAGATWPIGRGGSGRRD